MKKQFQSIPINRGASYSLTQVVRTRRTFTPALRKEGNIKAQVYIIVLFLGSLLAGCATPRDEYTDQAGNHSVNLEQRREKREKDRSDAIARIRTYVPKVTQEQQFFSDGWNIRDLIDGRVGILVATVNVDNLDLTLGFVENFHSLSWQSSTPTIHLKMVEDLNTYDSKIGDALLTNVMEARKNRSHYSVQYHFYNSGSDDDLATRLCTLRFTRGMLTAVQWLK